MSTIRRLPGPVPAARPAASVPAAFSGDPRESAATRAPRADALWQVELFAMPLTAPVATPDAVSARHAFQDALHDRALLLDARGPSERRRDGRLPGWLPVVEARRGVDLTALALAERLYVFTGDGGAIEPAELAGFDRDDPPVRLVDGGFASWVAAGLPVSR